MRAGEEVEMLRHIKFAQVSDTHLMPKHACRCWWMVDSPADQLRLCVESLQAIPDLDFVVFTGDLVDQADPASFREFQSILQELPIPYFLSVGNHDIDSHGRRGRFNRAQFLEWCQEQFTFTPAPTGFAEYSLSPCPGFRILSIDASLGPFPASQGALRPIQLEWIASELKTHAQDWILVLIHQPPLASVLFRRYRILPEQARQLHRLFLHHQRVNQGQIMGVLSGHFHIPKVDVNQGIPYLVAPALVGPVSAFRVFQLEIQPNYASCLHYTWHPMSSADPSPLWHGLVGGIHADRWGQILLKTVKSPVLVGIARS